MSGLGVAWSRARETMKRYGHEAIESLQLTCPYRFMVRRGLEPGARALPSVRLPGAARHPVANP